MQTILITGAYGALGSSLVKKFCECSQNKVIILVKSTSSSYRLTNEIINKTIKFESDKQSLNALFDLHHIDHIIHTATSYGRGIKNSDLIENNILFPIRLLELSIEHNTQSFINTDSYFNKFATYSYLNSYILTKKNLLEWLQKYENIKIFNLKLEHIYSGNDSDRKFVNDILKKFFTKSKFIELSEGTQKRDFIYISDVVNFYATLIQAIHLFDNGFYEFEVGTGKSLSIKDFVLKMSEIFKNNRTELRFGAIPSRENEIADSKADLSKIPSFIKWNSEINISQGLQLIHDQWKN